MSLFPRFKANLHTVAIPTTPATPVLQSSENSESSRPEDPPVTVPPSECCRYREIAEVVVEDCFAIDPEWLIERHPELWRRLASLDTQAMQVERQDGAVAAYQRILRAIVATVKNIHVLYETEQPRLPSVQ